MSKIDIQAMRERLEKSMPYLTLLRPAGDDLRGGGNRDQRETSDTGTEWRHGRAADAVESSPAVGMEIHGALAVGGRACRDGSGGL